MNSIKYSVILPVYNEEDNVAPLVEELDAALGPLGEPYEILIVDDCSTDSSAARGQNIADTSSYVKVIRHSKNCGQSAAVATGFANANGEFIITLDSDLQNDPADLPKLIEALTPDLAAVCGRRANRQDNFIRKASSRIGNGVRNWLTGDQVADTGCALRVIRKSALYEIPVFNGLHRFLPTLLRIKGHQVIEIPVSHRPRVAGVSKYGVANRAWRGLVDCIAIRWFKKRAFPANRLK